MPLEMLGMFGAGTGGNQDAIANIDIPQDGLLVGVDWDVRIDMDADAEVFDAELSFIATSQFFTNDTRGRISSVSAIQTVLDATGGQLGTIQKFVPILDLILHGGERLFLHIISSTGVGGNTRCTLHFVGGTTTPRRSARR